MTEGRREASVPDGIGHRFRLSIPAPEYEETGVEAAAEAARAAGVKAIRVIDLEDTGFMTSDYKPGRLNLFTRAGLVVRAIFG